MLNRFLNRFKKNKQEPLFSVVIANADRGIHILPTIESVLMQTISNFELLIIGDGCDKKNLVCIPRSDSRIKIHNLPKRSGSQAAPNNFGIDVARGTFIAYLGHDDIWMPYHLETLLELLQRPDCGVAISGCAYHGPEGTNRQLITGIFDSHEFARKYFFPPSSFAHRKTLAAVVGGWLPAAEVVAPVDADFLLRTEAQGFQFLSTKKVTVHKFAAGERYLSYLIPSSAEQNKMLQGIKSETMNAKECELIVARAKRANTFMINLHTNYNEYKPGELYQQNRFNKGIDRIPPKLLNEYIYVPQGMEPRGLDWYPEEYNETQGLSFRWSGPSLKPKLLVPFHGGVQALIKINVYDPFVNIQDLKLQFNGEPVPFNKTETEKNSLQIDLIVTLKESISSILEFILSKSYSPAHYGESADARELGIMVLGFSIEPVSPTWRGLSAVSRGSLDTADDPGSSPGAVRRHFRGSSKMNCQ